MTRRARSVRSQFWNRRFAFKLHGWCGFLLSILMFVICISGTFAVVSNEIDWLINPDLRSAVESRPMAWEKIHQNVRALRPEAHILWLQAPVEPGFAVEAVMFRPELKHPWRVYANPYSGEIQGEHGWLTVQRFVRNFHMYLYTPRWGKYLVTVFGWLMLASLITGVIVYRKWWRGFFTLEWNRGDRIRWGSAHKIMGVWSLWFVALISVTGVWYFVEALMFDLTDFRYISTPPIDASTLAQHGPAPAIGNLDDMVAAAERAVPGFRLSQIVFPEQDDNALTITGQTDAWLVRDRANRIGFHPYTGELQSVQLAQDLSPAWRWVDTADPLHFGDFGGLFSKLVWFVFGLVLNAMILSGAWLYLRRMNRFAEKEPASEADEPASASLPAVASEALRHG
jgi:uncharacterized iron-regulated membrane protein